MQQVHIEIVRSQAFEAVVTSPQRPFVRGVRRQNLAHQECLFSSAFDDGSNNGFRLTIHLGRIDVVHAEIEPDPERLCAFLSELPRPLSDDRNVDAS